MLDVALGGKLLIWVGSFVAHLILVGSYFTKPSWYIKLESSFMCSPGMSGRIILAVCLIAAQCCQAAALAMWWVHEWDSSVVSRVWYWVVASAIASFVFNGVRMFLYTVPESREYEDETAAWRSRKTFLIVGVIIAVLTFFPTIVTLVLVAVQKRWLNAALFGAFPLMLFVSIIFDLITARAIKKNHLPSSDNTLGDAKLVQYRLTRKLYGKRAKPLMSERRPDDY